MSSKLSIVYMGTPDFAVLPLQKILEAGHAVKGVITAPDRPAGRGRKLHPSAVKQYALAQGLHVLQPEKLRAEKFVEELKALEADVFVVVAFRMLPKVVWQIPKRGTFNLHASLLPQYRGAAPINWAIINGENRTGVTTFFINEEIDTGEILLQTLVSIDEKETAGTLHDKLMESGANLVVDTLLGIAENSLNPQKQAVAAEIKVAPKIFKEDCQIDWTKNGEEIERLIRGLSPYPGAFTLMSDGIEWKQLKILDADFISKTHKNQAGTLKVGDKELRIWLDGGYLKLNQIKPEGKRTMSATDFINGMPNKEQVYQVQGG